MRKLKIFHINMHLKWGGQPNRVLTTAEGLRAVGHEVTVSGPKGSMLVERAVARGFKVFDDIRLKSGFRPHLIWQDVMALRRHFEQVKYDVVDTHGSQDTWAVRYALIGVKHQPAFIRTRHNIFPVSGNPLNKWLYGRIQHIVTISPQVIPHLLKVVRAEDCTSIYSAPDPERFKVPVSRDETRKDLGISADAKAVGVVARLAPEKGHRYLVEAAPEIIARFPDAKFVFVGVGRSKGDIEAQAASLGVADHLILTGFREDVPALLQSFDLFVLCPDSGESLGTSILEAFLMERPVVATDVGGVGESVIDGVTGRLIPPSQPKLLAEAVIWMLEHPTEARQMALAGKARVEQLFTPEHIARQTEAVYYKVLNESGSTD